MQQITFGKFVLNALLIAACFLTFTANGQKAYIGGNETLPVINTTDYQLETTIYGFSSQLRWMQSSSDNAFIYSGTIFYQPELNLYKIDATTDEILISNPVDFAVQDLEISGDDQCLYHHNSTTVYKVDANTLDQIDSIYTGKIINFIECIDNNTLIASSTERIYKLDLSTHTIIDSVVFGTFESPSEMVLNSDKTKLFALKNSLPLTLWVVDMETMSVENTVSLSGMLGSPGDLILSPDGTKLFVTSTGSTSLNGTIRVINVSGMTTIADIEKDYGSGVMSFSINGDLWVPNNVSNTIAVIDTQTNQVKTVVNTDNYLAGPFSVAFGMGTTEINEIKSKNSITLHPNPATTMVTVLSEDMQTNITSCSIIDNRGKTVRKCKVKNGQSINISRLKTGLYLVAIQFDGKLQSTKLIVR